MSFFRMRGKEHSEDEDAGAACDPEVYSCRGSRGWQFEVAVFRFCQSSGGWAGSLSASVANSSTADWLQAVAADHDAVFWAHFVDRSCQCLIFVGGVVFCDVFWRASLSCDLPLRAPNAAIPSALAPAAA
jgi:hypothetical protein